MKSRIQFALVLVFMLLMTIPGYSQSKYLGNWCSDEEGLKCTTSLEVFEGGKVKLTLNEEPIGRLELVEFRKIEEDQNVDVELVVFSTSPMKGKDREGNTILHRDNYYGFIKYIGNRADGKKGKVIKMEFDLNNQDQITQMIEEGNYSFSDQAILLYQL